MITVDAQVLAATVAATFASALLVGLAPAIRLAKMTLSEALKEGSRTTAGGRHQRTGRAFAGIEVALSFVLVICSGLLFRSFAKMVSSTPASGQKAR